MSIYLCFNCLDELEAHFGCVIYSDLGKNHQSRISNAKIVVQFKTHADHNNQISLITFLS